MNVMQKGGRSRAVKRSASMVGLVTVVLGVSCVTSSLQQHQGVWCPPDAAFLDGACVNASALAACAAKSFGEQCALAEGGTYVCAGSGMLWCQVSACGDGVTDVRLREACDAGAANSNEPNALCRADCTATRCGDGVFDDQLGEVCDDGNVSGGDGCAGDCRSNETCGNAVLDSVTDEQCDFGASGWAGIGCAYNCAIEIPNWEEITPPAMVDPVGGIDRDGRGGGAMAYDARRNRVVYVGGDIGGEVWERVSEATWVHVRTAHTPGERALPALAYDPVRRQIILHGGRRAGVWLNDTWRYDGVDWYEVTTTAPPPAEPYPSLVYAPWRGGLALLGKHRTFLVGTEWIFEGVDSEGPGFGTAAMYDPDSGTIVAVGGLNRAEDWRSTTATVHQLSNNGWTITDFRVEGWGGGLFREATGSWLLVGQRVADEGTVRRSATGTWTNLNQWMWAEYQSGVSMNGQIFIVGQLPAVDSNTVMPPVPQIWDGDRWQQEPDRGYVPSVKAVSVYDRLRSRLYSFGDARQCFCDRKQISYLAAGDWHAAPNTPFDLDGPIYAVYDEHNDTIWLIANGRMAGFADGGQWREVAAPPTIYGWVYSPQENAVIALGPQPSDPQNPALATWRFDGAQWQQLAVAGPPVRTGFGLAVKRQTGAILLVGGETTAGPLNDRWQWQNGNWQQLPHTGLPAGAVHLVFHEARRTMMAATQSTAARPATLYSEVADGVWRKVATAISLANHPGSAVAYDAANAMLVQFGGRPSLTNEFATPKVFGLRYRSATAPPDVCGATDSDGDGKVACGTATAPADPDCWWQCNPACSPTDVAEGQWPAACPATGRRCGDAVCDFDRENYLLCPSDCEL